MTPTEFWASTPIEVALAVEAAGYRRDQALTVSVAGAYSNAALMNWRDKSFPGFCEFMQRYWGIGGTGRKVMDAQSVVAVLDKALR